MKRLLMVPGPTSHFRPEGRIFDSILKAVTELSDLTDWHIIIADTRVDFDQLGSQSHFYDHAAVGTSAKAFIDEVFFKWQQPFDVIFFIDAWNPLVSLYRYFEHLRHGKRTTKLCGIFHSSVGVSGEMFGSMENDWGVSFEQNLFDSLDEIYVATEWGRDKVVNALDCKGRAAFAVKVTGLPWSSDCEGLIPTVKEPYSVVFPHRWADDKGIDKFKEIVKLSKEQNLPLKFKVLHPVELEQDRFTVPYERLGVEFVLCDTRDRYIAKLQAAQIVISTARLETFGYGVLEGVQAYCVPCLPDQQPYREMYNHNYLYRSTTEAAELLMQLCAIEQARDTIRTPSECFTSPFIERRIYSAATTIANACLELGA